jgi:predicted PurR-regulated permease PerM
MSHSEPPPAPVTVTATPPVPGTTPLTYRDLQRTVFLVFGLLVIWHLAAPLTTLILFFLLVFILAAVLNPIAVRLQRMGIPRLGSALLMALFLLGLIGTLASIGLPPLLSEVSQFVQRSPEKQARLFSFYNDLLARYPDLASVAPSPDDLAKMLTPRITDLLGQVGRYTLNLVGAVVSFFVLLVLVVFSVAHPAPLVTGFLGAVPERYRGRFEKALRRILYQLKNWAFGSLILGLIIGLMTASGLWGLGKITGHPFPYILLFSVVAGIGEMIPTIGPIVSAVPPTLVALTIDPMLAVWVIVLFIIIQQLENNLVVPVVMGHTLDFHPVSIIFAVLVMGTLFGLFGAVLAMPIAAIIKVCWEEFYLVPRNTDTEALQVLAEDIVQNGATGRDTPGEGPKSERGAAAAVTDAAAGDGEVKGQDPTSRQ